ncbi:hypothetical protein AYO20_03929 [Fonsecaea nubica]|uniref:Uncharacterized protein n=1 Tax=Fonsecaea nubica TaxID=856822 RepID=A0A178D6I0_9EURO|nr:hypothetical protein AYO20_03929 [Fonsecaea nubica]OAL36873.1 hypothetical protein AYO20_03929 [Fonsecaea nubica]
MLSRGSQVFNSIFLLGSLGSFFVRAQNDCRARSFGCWRISHSNPPGSQFGDFHLAFDRIPDGSVSSICGNLAKGLGSDSGQEFDNIGCETLSVAGAENGVLATGNSMAVSSQVAVNIDDAIKDFMPTFNRVLQCQSTSSDVPCLELADTMPVGQESPTVDTLGTGLVLTTIGQTYNIQAGGQIGMIFYSAVHSGALATLQLDNALTNAIGSISAQVYSRFQDLPDSSLMVADAPIGDTGLVVKTVVDIGLFNWKDKRGKNLGHSMSQAEWDVLFFDLYSDAMSFSQNVLAAVYSAEAVGHGQTPDIFVSLVIGLEL